MSKLLSRAPSNEALNGIILSLIIFSPILQVALIPVRTFLSYQETLSEGISLSEAFTARKFEPFTELIPITEAIDVNVYRLHDRDISDTIAISEEIETIINRLNQMTLSEDIHIEEAFLGRKCPLFTIDLMISEEIETIINRLNRMTLSDVIVLSDVLNVIIYRYYQLGLTEGISVEEIFLSRKYPLLPIDLLILDDIDSAIERARERVHRHKVEEAPLEFTRESNYEDEMLTLSETVRIVITRAIHRPFSERVEVDETLSPSKTEASAEKGLTTNQLIRITITSIAVLAGIFGFILITKSLRGR